MACSGECKIQVYDFDLSGLEIDSPRGCKVKSIEDLRDEILKEIEVKGYPITPTALEPLCEGAGCVCIPLDVKPTWTVWCSDGLSVTITTDVFVKNSDQKCKYTVKGPFAYSSTILNGNCAPGKKDSWKLPRNPKSPTKETKNKEKEFVREAPGEAKVK